MAYVVTVSMMVRVPIIVVTVLILVWDSDAGIEKGTDNRIASTNTA